MMNEKTFFKETEKKIAQVIYYDLYRSSLSSIPFTCIHKRKSLVPSPHHGATIFPPSTIVKAKIDIDLINFDRILSNM